MVVTVTTRSLCMADTATTDPSQHMVMIPTVIKSQLMVGTTTTDTSQPMAKNHMVTKRQLTVGTTTTDTSRPMATIPTVTNNQCMADTKSIVMVILTDTKKPYGKKYDSSHVDNTIKKVGEYADAQEDYKTQSLNVKYSYDAVPTEYDYVEKYGWGRPTTIGSLYNGYGNQYPQQYGYGHQDSYGYKTPSYGYKRPSYGYKKPRYGKKPYGYKPKYGKKPKEDQDWEEPKEETHEDGDWKDDTDKDWEE